MHCCSLVLHCVQWIVAC